MASLIGQDIGHYHLVEQLGQGGMATIYKAFDTRLERVVAIKIIRSTAFSPETLGEMLKRFEREAKALARLSHPNIVKIHDYGDYQGSPYLVMEYLPGGTLKQRYTSEVPWGEAVRLLTPIARALAYAHSHNILHRDVKPSNILITETGEPMLSDFGIAKILDLGDGHTLTATGVGIGTPEYMAPEQGIGSQVDARSDIYALGVVLYEMITGFRPFTADTPMAVILKHMSEPLPRPSQYVNDLPEAVEQVLFKAMAKRPEDRYENMMAFVAALEKLTSLAAVLETHHGARASEVSSSLPQPAIESRSSSIPQVQPTPSHPSQPSIAAVQKASESGVTVPPSKPAIVKQPVHEEATRVIPRTRKKTPWVWIVAGGIVVFAFLLVIGFIAVSGLRGAINAAATGTWKTAQTQAPDASVGSQGQGGGASGTQVPGIIETLPLPKPTEVAVSTSINVPAVVMKMGLLRINTGFFPDTLDPQKAQNTSEVSHLSMIYEGLTRLDGNLETIPAAAESWKYSSDAKQLTLTLKKGLMYSDGVMLNARRFADALQRNIDPATNGGYNFITDEIIGAPEWRSADPNAAGYNADRYISSLGIKTFTTGGEICTRYDQEDCLILQLNFSNPAPYFHTILSIWVAYPVRIELIEAGGDEWWKNPRYQIGNGPFILKVLDASSKSYLIPNPAYQGQKPLTEIEYYYFEDSDLAFEKYVNNDLDVIVPGIDKDSAIMSDPNLKDQFIQYPGSCTIVIKFGLKTKVNGQPSPFLDKKVREAFAYAFDAEGWVQEVDGGTSSSTRTWIPQGFPGYDPGFQPYKFDPVLARKTLAESKYGGPDRLNALGLTIQYSDSERNRTRMEWLAANYLKNLGVNIVVQPVEAASYSQLVSKPETFPLLVRQGWCADYPDPQDWLSVYWKSTSTFASRQGFSLPGFDELIARADTTVDAGTRMALYIEAQQLLLSEVPAAFGFNTKNRFLVKPWVKGYLQTPQDVSWPGQVVPMTVYIDPTIKP